MHQAGLVGILAMASVAPVLTMVFAAAAAADDRKWVTTHLQGRVIDEYNANDDESLQRLTGTMFFRVRDKLDVVRAQRESARARMSTQATYDVECYSHRDAVGLQTFRSNHACC